LALAFFAGFNFFGLDLAAFLPALPVDFFAVFFATVFLAAACLLLDFLPTFFAVRFGAARFFFRSGGAATGAVNSGSETRPSAASGI
jgi:hypothetical protein